MFVENINNLRVQAAKHILEVYCELDILPFLGSNKEVQPVALHFIDNFIFSTFYGTSCVPVGVEAVEQHVNDFIQLCMVIELVEKVQAVPASHFVHQLHTNGMECNSDNLQKIFPIMKNLAFYTKSCKSKHSAPGNKVASTPDLCYCFQNVPCPVPFTWDRYYPIKCLWMSFFQIPH